MAEPKPSDPKPRLVAVDPSGAGAAVDRSPTPAPGATAREKPRRFGIWLLVLLLLAVTIAALVQTQRLGQSTARVSALSEQVVGLQAQLSAAHTQIATYELQRGQIRDAVSDVSQRMMLLSELVGGESPLLEPAPER